MCLINLTIPYVPMGKDDKQSFQLSYYVYKGSCLVTMHCEGDWITKDAIWKLAFWNIISGSTCTSVTCFRRKKLVSSLKGAISLPWKLSKPLLRCIFINMESQKHVSSFFFFKLVYENIETVKGMIDGLHIHKVTILKKKKWNPESRVRNPDIKNDDRNSSLQQCPINKMIYF